MPVVPAHGARLLRGAAPCLATALTAALPARAGDDGVTWGEFALAVRAVARGVVHQPHDSPRPFPPPADGPRAAGSGGAQLSTCAFPVHRTDGCAPEAGALAAPAAQGCASLSAASAAPPAPPRVPQQQQGP
eukprot:gene45181-62444_t